MAQFGSFPGVKVETTGGAITGVAVGREQFLVIFGVGDPNNGSATTNDPTQVNSRVDAERKFGSGTELTAAVKDALANGANLDFLYGVMLGESSATDTITGGSGTLTNVPIIEDLSRISAQNVTDGVAADDIQFRYDSPPTAPTSANVVHINPHTGEVEAGDTDDYDITYDYAQWSSGLDSADSIVNEEETGVYCALSEAETVASNLSTKVTNLRDKYKMVVGVTGAEPNSNSTENPPDARIDTANYTDSIDSDSMFLSGPVRLLDTKYTVLGGIGGMFAGHPLNDPVYDDVLSGFTEIEQKISKAGADDLRNEEVIPVRQEGAIRVADNMSTSTATDWERDFWTRRIVDEVILIAKGIGDAVVGRINDEDTRQTAETEIEAQMRQLVRSRLIKPDTDTETNWFVDVYEIDTETVGIDLGITPFGIVKRVDVTVTIRT